MRLLIHLCFISTCLSAFAHGDLHERIEKASKAIEQHPDSAGLYLKRGELYHQHGDYTDARDDFFQYRNLNPTDIRINKNLAEVYKDMGKADSAIIFIEHFLVQNPRHVNALILRAEIHGIKEDHGKASDDYRAAIQYTDEPLPENFLNLSTELLKSDSGNYQPALDALDEGISKLGFIITLQERKIEILRDHKQYERAITEIDKVIEKLPRHEVWLIEKGKLLEKLQENEDAVHCYQQALAAIEHLPDRHRMSQMVQQWQEVAGQRIQVLTNQQK